MDYCTSLQPYALYMAHLLTMVDGDGKWTAEARAAAIDFCAMYDIPLDAGDPLVQIDSEGHQQLVDAGVTPAYHVVPNANSLLFAFNG